MTVLQRGMNKDNIYIEFGEKKLLADVVAMRLVLIFLLIGTHAFAPYSGSWETLSNPSSVIFYQHISGFTHYISMPAFVFVSGYLFGYSWNRTRTQSWTDFIIKKFKRLIIPSIAFSTIYYCIFYDTSASLSQIFYSIVNGCGHLWFLPMLFWCFIACFIILKFNLKKPLYVLPILILIAIIPIPTLPFRLSSACYYLVYFYIGSIIQWRGGVKLQCISVLWFYVFTLVYVVLQITVIEVHVTSSSFAVKLLELTGINALKLSLGAAGIAIVFIATRLFLARYERLPERIIILSTLCYGVYIFHQFVLKIFYYQTSATEYIHPDILPWVAFIITLFLSVGLSSALMKTNLGRYFIG